MASLMHVSDAAALGLHAMVLLAASEEGPMATRQIAEELGASEAHLSKVLQRLARVGLVRGTRGPGGGFTLDCDPRRVSLLDVYEAIEGPLNPSDCLFRTPICGGDRCIFGDLLKELNAKARRFLAEKQLSELTDVFAETRRPTATREDGR
jgi:Rrf2 family protein